jgi:hypothetical protein
LSKVGWKVESAVLPPERKLPSSAARAWISSSAWVQVTVSAAELERAGQEMEVLDSDRGRSRERQKRETSDG